MSLALALAAEPSGIYDRVDGKKDLKGVAPHLCVMTGGAKDRYLVLQGQAMYEVVRKGSALEPTEAALAAAKARDAAVPPTVTVKDDKTLVSGKVEWVRTKELAALAVSAPLKLTADGDSLEVGPGLVMTGRLTQRSKQTCLRGALVPTKQDQPAPKPPLASLPFWWIGVGVECDQPLKPWARVEDSLGGVYVLVKDGTVVGATIVGYMFAQTFLEPGLDDATKKLINGVGDEAAATQAE